MLGDNLPSPSDVIQLFKKYNIGKIRLFEPVPEVLQALRGSGIEVTIGVRDQDIPALAASPDATKQWFDTYIIPGEFDQYFVPAMKNFQNVLNGYGYAGIKVTTAIATTTLAVGYPPSAGAFMDSARATLAGILDFLSSTSSPLLANVYPYYAYVEDPVNVRLDYALFTASGPVVQDGSLSYSNLLDAQLDAIYSAMEKLGVSGVDLVVSESGWPSAGNGDIATPELAGTYNRNFLKKFLAMEGTPKRPNTYLEGFIFAMFNEDQKPAGIEQHFGLFNPDGTPVHPVFS
ncbi:hypothetical protein CRG98_005931 [Punica granatum]|uniref:glucan endo-1,3-beta-D-glucosidase n=1 Tax=Punica granatum TaxID=22663 RepID=A0A2I0KZD8_PUNGR|nr:hypothetical protein CRG98_005931 [Punica granatum]